MDHFALKNKEQLLDLAVRHGTPLYYYDGARVREQYKLFRSFFSFPRVGVHYAMKANYNPTLLRILCEEGCNIDAVSHAEVLLALQVGFRSSDIMYTSNMISDTEMHTVAALGVLFNIDSLSRLEKFGCAFPGSRVCLRFNPEVVTGHHDNVKTGGDETKFGINLRNIDSALAICSRYGLRVVGVHEHAGSGIPETVDMEAGMSAILRLVTLSRFPDLEFVDFGGGFKVPYKPGEKVVDYAAFGVSVSAMFSTFCSTFGGELEMRFEPGRFLVAEAGYLLVTVNTLKYNGDRRIVGVDSGFPQLIRPMFYGAYHHITNVSALIRSDVEVERYDVVGNICETGDRFAKDRMISTISEGDILCIHTAGAYGYAMGGVYNLRAMPTEVVIDSTDGVTFVEFVRKGLSAQELIDSVLSK